jgi:NAD/NADP transhydrogenase beta subunit
MNVLLAEANVPYDRPYDPEENSTSGADVGLVIGANDVVNAPGRQWSPIVIAAREPILSDLVDFRVNEYA